MVAAAVVGAGIGGALISSSASKSAAKSQVSAANSANAEAARQYDQTRADQLALLDQQRADQAPWLEAGKNALTQLTAGTQTGGQFMKSFTMDDFQADPGYQFRLDQGTQAIERSAAARGGLLSGAAAKALTRYSQGVASDEYNNAYNRFNNDQSTQYNRLASLAGVGQAATNQVGQASQSAYGTIASAGQNTSNSIQNNLTGAGNARASGYVGTANALTNGISQGMNWYQNNQLLSQLGGSNPGWVGYSAGQGSATPLVLNSAMN